MCTRKRKDVHRRRTGCAQADKRTWESQNGAEKLLIGVSNSSFEKSYLHSKSFILSHPLTEWDKKTCILYTIEGVTTPVLLVANHIFFLLQNKFLGKIIAYTINLCNFRLWKRSDNCLYVIIGHYKFNHFIAMFLIINGIFIHSYHIHIK